MRRAVLSFLAFIAFSLFSLACQADVRVSGQASLFSVKFADGTIQTTATLQGPQGIQGPQGERGYTGVDGQMGPQGLEGTCPNIAPAPLHYVTFPNNKEPVWFMDSAHWVQLQEPQTFDITYPQNLTLTFSENVGVYGPSWCQLGVFLNDDVTPVCVGSYSGVSGSIIFNNQTLKCVISPVLTSSLVVTLKHRSQYCHYGNSAFDDLGSNRSLLIEERLP